MRVLHWIGGAIHDTNRNTSAGPIVKQVNYEYDPYNRLGKRSLDPDGAGPNPATSQYWAYDQGINALLQFDGSSASNLSHRYLWAEQVDQLLADEQITSPSVPGNTLQHAIVTDDCINQYKNNPPIASNDPVNMTIFCDQMREIWEEDEVVGGVVTIFQIGIGVFVEPVDWAFTAYEIYKEPCSPWNYAGLIPFIPAGAGKIGAKAANVMPSFSGTSKPWTSGATPNSKYTHLGSDGKAIQNSMYDANGDVIAHVDYKNHGPGAPSGHGHHFPDPGNPASGHGPGLPHILPSDLPPEWIALPPGILPRTPIGR